MRERNEIEKDVQPLKIAPNYIHTQLGLSEKIFLEVLLDIRDLLSNQLTDTK